MEERNYLIESGNIIRHLMKKLNITEFTMPREELENYNLPAQVLVIDTKFTDDTTKVFFRDKEEKSCHNCKYHVDYYDSSGNHDGVCCQKDEDYYNGPCEQWEEE